MDRPATSLIASIAVHGAVVGAVFGAMLLAGPGKGESTQVVNAVPVSIVSTQIIEAGPADAPSDDLMASDAETAPPPTAPEPPPPDPLPVPSPRPPTPAARSTPKAPAVKPPPPSRPPPTKRGERTPPEDTLCLSCLAGEAQRNPRNPRTPNNRPPAGDRGSGTAARAVGPSDLNALAAQIYPNWDLPCNLPGGRDATIPVRVTLDPSGRVVGAVRATHPNAAVAGGVERAVRASAPFRMPSGYQQQELRFSFRTTGRCG